MNNKNKTDLFLLCLLLLLTACGGGSSNPSSGIALPPIARYQQPPNSICDDSMLVDNGLLCAIRPSRINSLSRDVYSNDNNEDFLLGFGFHVIAFPNTDAEVKGVNIHLTGSYGRPYDQSSSHFSTSTFLNESLTAGYISIQLAYDNRFAINIEQCGGTPERFTIDNCAGDVRFEKITGQDVSTVTNTPIEDSIEYRLIALIQHLENVGVVLPVHILTSNTIDWTQLNVSGHSQGGTHALYLGKYFNAAHICMLAAGYDVPDTVPSVPPENIADWLLDDSVTLDLNKVSAIVSIDDSAFNYFIGGFNVLGLQEGVHYQTFSGSPYRSATGEIIDGHTAAISDPRYSALRIEACFE